MEKKVRAKFICGSVENTGTVPEYPQQTVSMYAVTDSGIPEDQQFSQMTPWGNLQIGINNPSLIGHFEVGKSYYLDITEA